MIGVALIDHKRPTIVVPVERAIEIVSAHVSRILIGCEHILQVQISAAPVVAIERGGTHRHEIVEVYLVYCLCLSGVESELIGHLVGKEERFLLCPGVGNASLGGSVARVAIARCGVSLIAVAIVVTRVAIIAITAVAVAIVGYCGAAGGSHEERCAGTEAHKHGGYCCV